MKPNKKFLKTKRMRKLIKERRLIEEAKVKSKKEN